MSDIVETLNRENIEQEETSIKCTTASLRFSNKEKVQKIHLFIDEYRRVCGIFIDLLWEIEEFGDIPTLVPKDITNRVSEKTWLSERAIQAAAKQSSGIVRGTRTKQNKRIKQVETLNKQGKFKQARKLQKFIDKAKITKPELKNVNPELDSRFVEMDFDNKTFFDGWVSLTSLGNKIKIIFPVKKSDHFNRILKQGILKKGVRISKKDITFMFELYPIPKKNKGEVVGVDIGKTEVLNLSNDHKSTADKDGHDLNTILNKIARRKKGSKGFKRACEHRNNYIRWCCNQIDFSNIKTLNKEKILNLRSGKRTNRVMSHWTYTVISDKILDLVRENGVHLHEMNPAFTSMRCSKCGWTCKANRRGKKFVCKCCGNTMDADKNASINISLELFDLSKLNELPRH